MKKKNLDLAKIKRKDLLELMLAQAERIKELENEINTLKSQLNQKEILISESGSIAEASLKLNDLFKNAQKAIDQYFDNIKIKCEKLEQETEKKCESMISDAKKNKNIQTKKVIVKIAPASKNKKKVKRKNDS